MEPRTTRLRRPKRWGLRSLAFLGLAAGSIIVSNYFQLSGNTDYALLPFIGMVTGLIGAAVCSLLGIRAWGGKAPRS